MRSQRASKSSRVRRTVKRSQLRSRARVQSRATKKIACMRPGPITRNPYLNFLRDFRKQHCGLSVIEMTIAGAKKWQEMSPQQKKVYEQSVKSSERRMVCMRPGPITRNPYLNFLREFRKKNCGFSFVKMAVEGGKCWRAMRPQDKRVYKQMAKSSQKKQLQRRLRH